MEGTCARCFDGVASFFQASPKAKDPEYLPMVAVGAHMRGLPLNWQLQDRRAVFVKEAQTAKKYQLYAFESEKKPGLIQVNPSEKEAAQLTVEVWNVPVAEAGRFLAMVPPPLSIGHIELETGEILHGFRTDEYNVIAKKARHISHFGGWRNYLKSLV
ncbi:unnamed protein product [Amoebophrya sp. A120]|nr:unnamed protein product [Amoebophrya sp. A120]|eukprot:GSA120T00002513001.1